MMSYLLFVLFFVMCYLLVKRLYVKRQVNQFQKRNSVSHYAKENSFKKLFSKINMIKTKENFLFLQGYPLHFNAISYYFVKILLAVLLGMAGIVNYHSSVIALILGFLRILFRRFLYCPSSKGKRQRNL